MFKVKIREDDATVRMYKDNPDMMKKDGPGGMKGLTKKAQQDVKKAMKEAADYPHMMYDPKSGKKVIAKTPDDHDKYAKMGYTHEKPNMEAKNSKPGHNMMAQRKSLDKIMKIIKK